MVDREPTQQVNKVAKVAVIGSYVQDLAFSTALFPVAGETRIGQFRPGPGGKGFNQAVACHRQGIPTFFIGAVGDDVFAHAVSDFARTEGLKTALEVRKEAPTGAASIVINAAAENMIVVALGANNYLSKDHIERYKDQIVSAQIVVSQLECSLDAIAHALKLARSGGATTILNPAPIHNELSAEFLKYADIITPNETEFSFLMQKLFNVNVGENYYQMRSEELHKLCCTCDVPTVILTLGKHGCFVSHNELATNKKDGANTRIHDRQSFYRVPALSITPLDTTGAGDAFNGGLAAGMLYYPNEFNKAVQYATTVAGLSTLKEGTAPAMPYREEVLKYKLPS